MSFRPIGARRRPAASVIASALGIALAGGASVGIGLAGWIASLNDWGFGADAVLLSVHLGGLYGLVFAAGLVPVAVLSLLVGWRPGPRVFLGLWVAFFVLLNGALRFSQVVQLVSVTPHMNAVGLVDAFVLLVVAGLLAWGIAAGGLARLALALLLVAALQVGNTALERPLRRNLAERVDAVLAESAPAPVNEVLDPFDAQLVLIGFDGVSWEMLLPLLERGELPGFRRLLEGAAYGYLETIPFSVSPVVWETISTGQDPEKHGIGWHAHFEFAGVEERVRRLPYFRLCKSPMGIRSLLVATAGRGPWPWNRIPAESTDAEVARLWEIASRNEHSVGVYRWMNTAPVTPVDGFMQGYGVSPPLIFPPDAEEGLPAVADPPLGLRPGLDYTASQLPHEESHFERFVELSLRYQPDVLLYYTHYVDASHHLNWKIDAVGDSLVHLGLNHPGFEPGEAISFSYRQIDRFLLDILDRLPPDAIVALVSDHGFDLRGYEHDNAPPGVIIVRGPGVRPGPVAGARIHDVTPTLLHLLGLPVADDMDGEVLSLAEPSGPLDRPVERVASYGPAATPAEAGQIDPKDLAEHEDYLKALGYMN